MIDWRIVEIVLAVLIAIIGLSPVVVTRSAQSKYEKDEQGKVSDGDFE